MGDNKSVDYPVGNMKRKDTQVDNRHLGGDHRESNPIVHSVVSGDSELDMSQCGFGDSQPTVVEKVRNNSPVELDLFEIDFEESYFDNDYQVGTLQRCNAVVLDKTEKVGGHYIPSAGSSHILNLDRYGEVCKICGHWSHATFQCEHMQPVTPQVLCKDEGNLDLWVIGPEDSTWTLSSSKKDR